MNDWASDLAEVISARVGVIKCGGHTVYLNIM